MGASTLNKLLIVVLMCGIAAGLAIVGPRRWFRSGWLYLGVGVTVLLALPSLVYQALNGWPQLLMGAALSTNNAEVRIMMWPFLILMVGPMLAVFWVSALVALFRRHAFAPLRFIGVAFLVVVGFVFAAGTQFYYTFGILSVLVALGSVVVAEWATTRGKRVAISILLGVNALGCILTSLPVLPLQVFAATGLASVNSAAADQVGWERYVEQIRTVATDTRADAIIASNYGEAGAMDRFGSDLPPIYSGHNALWQLGAPPEGAETIVFVGGQADRLSHLFHSCLVADRLDNGVDVDTEEQGEPIMVCTSPSAPWSELWEQFRHLD